MERAIGEYLRDIKTVCLLMQSPKEMCRLPGRKVSDSGACPMSDINIQDSMYGCVRIIDPARSPSKYRAASCTPFGIQASCAIAHLCSGNHRTVEKIRTYFSRTAPMQIFSLVRRLMLCLCTICSLVSLRSRGMSAEALLLIARETIWLALFLCQCRNIRSSTWGFPITCNSESHVGTLGYGFPEYRPCF